MAPSGENDVASNMTLEKVLAMKGGEGETSYANNSAIQGNSIRALLPLIKETLAKVQLNSSGVPFQIVDLGCASGGNTIYIMDVMVRHMMERFESNGLQLPEFSALFNDLPNNDFNTLFLQLQNNDVDGITEKSLAASKNIDYFVAGVPGSFYRRLFPARSIDVFFSSNCLHWLTKVPDEVLDRRSTAYNKGRVFIHGANEATANAYKKLWQDNLTSFLRARSQEIKKGGSMFICSGGRPSTDPVDQGPVVHIMAGIFQDAWNDLIREGLITSEQRDDFNIPMYVPTVEDFRDVLEADGSFTINKLELFREANAMQALLGNNHSWTEMGRNYAKFLWGLTGVIVEANLGDRLSTELFSRLEHHSEAKAKELSENLQIYSIVASLICCLEEGGE